jgi:CheY-like chemotaxis protein
MGAPSRTIRVLCVDDNRDAAETLAVLLELIGFETRACFDGPTALAVADEFRPDVCLLDVNMPRMDGHELAGRLRSAAGGRPMMLVAATARSDDADRDRTAGAGFHHHLVKPIDLTSLLDAMSTFVGSRWQRGERASGAAAGPDWPGDDLGRPPVGARRASAPASNLRPGANDGGDPTPRRHGPRA